MTTLTPAQQHARDLMTPATYARLAPAEPQRVGRGDGTGYPPAPTLDQLRLIAVILGENAQVHRNGYDVELGDACMAVGWFLRRQADALAEAAKKPIRTRSRNPRDRKIAEAKVIAFMSQVRDDFRGKPAPSLSEVRRLAEKAGVRPRDLVDSAYRSEFILDAPKEG